MDDKSAWVLKVLGIAVPTRTGGEDGSTELTPEKLRAQLLARIREMLIEGKLLPDPSVMPALTALADKADLAVKGTDLVAAEIAVDELEMAVARAKSAARSTEAGKVKGRVNYRKAQIEWRAARGVARSRIEALGAMVLADERVRAEPDFDELAQMIDDFATLLPAFDSALEEQLEEIDGLLDPQARAPLIRQAAATVADYRDTLAGAEALAALQALADDEYGGIDIVHELDAALRKIESTLSA